MTEGRRKILALFSKTDHALAHSDIQNKYASLINRVSVYRTLQSFLEKG